jgi:hypothetical protein
MVQPTWLNDVGYVYSMKWVSDGRVIGYPALSTNVNFSNGGPTPTTSISSFTARYRADSQILRTPFRLRSGANITISESATRPWSAAMASLLLAVLSSSAPELRAVDAPALQAKS